MRFLLPLQGKQKWSSTRRYIQQEDIVILKGNCRQNEWKFAKVIENIPDKKGFV